MKPGGMITIVRGQVVDGGVPEAEEGRLDAAAQEVEHVLDSGLPVGGQAPQVGPPDHHRLRPQGERLDHVAAPPDPPVEEHLDLIAHGLGDRLEGPDGGRRAVEVVAPVVRDRDGASRPASTARLASSIRVTPLSMNAPSHCSRSQATSSQLGGGVCIQAP